DGVADRHGNREANRSRVRAATDVTRHRLTPSSPIAYASAPWLQASEIQPTDRVGLRLTRSELKIELWIDDYTYEGALEPEVLVAGRADQHLPGDRPAHGPVQRQG